MNCSKIFISLIAPLCVYGAALAQEESGGAYPLDPPIPAPLLSRAEVVADLQIWRESGAAATHLENEGGTNFTDPVVLASEQRYAAMRASPTFAMLIASLARQVGEGQQIAGKSGGGPAR